MEINSLSANSAGQKSGIQALYSAGHTRWMWSAVDKLCTDEIPDMENLQCWKVRVKVNVGL